MRCSEGVLWTKRPEPGLESFCPTAFAHYPTLQQKFPMPCSKGVPWTAAQPPIVLPAFARSFLLTEKKVRNKKTGKVNRKADDSTLSFVQRTPSEERAGVRLKLISEIQKSYKISDSEYTAIILSVFHTVSRPILVFHSPFLVFHAPILVFHSPVLVFHTVSFPILVFHF
jgi:hypothetical protein